MESNTEFLKVDREQDKEEVLEAGKQDGYFKGWEIGFRGRKVGETVRYGNFRGRETVKQTFGDIETGNKEISFGTREKE